MKAYHGATVADAPAPPCCARWACHASHRQTSGCRSVDHKPDVRLDARTKNSESAYLPVTHHGVEAWEMTFVKGVVVAQSCCPLPRHRQDGCPAMVTCTHSVPVSMLSCQCSVGAQLRSLHTFSVGRARCLNIQPPGLPAVALIQPHICALAYGRPQAPTRRTAAHSVRTIAQAPARKEHQRAATRRSGHQPARKHALPDSAHL
jgi:hypothetical protein